MDGPTEGELPTNGRLYTVDELLAIFELTEGDTTELVRHLPHSKLGASIVLSGDSVLRTLAAWGVKPFLDSVRADRDSDRDF